MLNQQEIAYRTLRGDLARLCLDVVKENADGRTWARLSEADQRTIINRINEAVGEGCRKAIDVVASAGMSVIGGTLEQVVIKGGFKAVVKGGKDPSTLLALAEAEGAQVKLVVMDPEWDHAREPLRPDPDQPDLPIPNKEKGGPAEPDMEAIADHLDAEDAANGEETAPVVVTMGTLADTGLEFPVKAGSTLVISALAFGAATLAVGPAQWGKATLRTDDGTAPALVYVAPEDIADPISDTFTLGLIDDQGVSQAVVAVTVHVYEDGWGHVAVDTPEELARYVPGRGEASAPAEPTDPIAAAVAHARQKLAEDPTAEAKKGEEPEAPKRRGRRKKDGPAPDVFA